MTEAKEIARALREEVCADGNPFDSYTAELVKQAADLLDPPPEGLWVPQVGSAYHYLDDAGRVQLARWDGVGVDLDYLAIGNVYRTREEAERAALRMRAMAKLRRAKGITVLTAMSPDPLILVTHIYEADTPENFEAAWATLTDEERAALLGGE